MERAIEHGRLKQIEKNYKLTLEETVRKRTQELAEALMKVKYVSKEVIQRVATASEFKDTETGAHISRMGLYAQKIAQTMNMLMDFVETITFASPMHDVGKIGIPDSILLKTERLTPSEFGKHEDAYNHRGEDTIGFITLQHTDIGIDCVEPS